MKRMIPLIFILTITFLIGISLPITLSLEKATIWEVYFSPNGSCTEVIIRELNKAKNTILVQAYSFTSAPVAKALLGAHKRGVKIEVILGKSQRTEKYSSTTFLFNSGIPTKIDAKHALAHNKGIIIDGEPVITGSFNFTKGAEEKKC